MTTPQWDRGAQYYPPVLGPDIEWLAQAFYTPLQAPTPVRTRLPDVKSNEDTIHGMLRVEAGPVEPCMDVYGTAWDATFLMHGYSPNEIQASQIIQNAKAYALAVGGTTIAGWYVIKALRVGGGNRLDDPLVPKNLVRYRAFATWRIAGKPPTTG